MRYHVYYHLILIAKQTDQVLSVFKDVETLKQHFATCSPSSEQLQKLYRLLHEVLLKSNQRYIKFACNYLKLKKKLLTVSKLQKLW